MEITEKNLGKYLGFRDDKNTIFINEDNYKKSLKTISLILKIQNDKNS